MSTSSNVKFLPQDDKVNRNLKPAGAPIGKVYFTQCQLSRHMLIKAWKNSAPNLWHASKAQTLKLPQAQDYDGKFNVDEL